MGYYKWSTTIRGEYYLQIGISIIFLIISIWFGIIFLEKIGQNLSILLLLPISFLMCLYYYLWRDFLKNLPKLTNLISIPIHKKWFFFITGKKNDVNKFYNKLIDLIETRLHQNEIVYDKRIIRQSNFLLPGVVIIHAKEKDIPIIIVRSVLEISIIIGIIQIRDNDYLMYGKVKKIIDNASKIENPFYQEKK